ncbi:Signal transduction histidine kinase CheA [Acidisarcina polymorpha]|uniref:histidine kinase n=1 Tax=Acidisarcina polymorpha TaxID=2211140 RepID=A0A2Z5G2X9_9BACT|nr:hybrid sensor histidine kinase/response regulator [Acidisarcina polymorpha]AXC12886.1 Signal transduction histidine kinase CheA [Acidisarcina polymorpha]
MEFAEEVREFLIESNENLGVLDREIVELEKSPADEKLIASVFRTIHTIKGTCGFFGFEILGSITHVAENILGQVREKQRNLTPDLVSLVLETVDVVKLVLSNIEEQGEEGVDVYQSLRQRLDDAYNFRSGSVPSAASGLAVSGTALPVAAPSTSSEGIDSPSMDLPADSSPSSAPADLSDCIHTLEERPLPALAAEEVEEDHTEPVTSPGAKQASPDSEPRVPKESNGAAGTSNGGSVADSTIRVDVTLLDKLMNLVGELVLARNQILQGTATQSGASSGAAQRLNLITSELQEGVMRTRMQPIGVVWNKLPRVVRDLASEVGKQIEIQMEGAETELDKTIIEAIKDPLTHIVRNSCDHGIESPDVRVKKGKKKAGTILLRAYHEGGHVNIEISDDGAGIDPERVKRKAVDKGLIRAEQAAIMSEWEALRLVFLPGFSTAEKITSISGRGVGMDVVKTNIEKIGGAVDLFNRPKAGSTVKIKIPLTLAIIPGLIVNLNSSRSSGGVATMRQDRFVIPQANLLELVRLEGAEDRKQIESIHGTEVYRRRGKLLPLTYLSRVLGLTPAHKEDDLLNIVILQAEDTAFGLVVDGVSDTQEIVVKALGKQLKSLSCYVGATIMGDGKIALILDVPGLGRLANILSQSLERGRTEAKSLDTVEDLRQTLLLFSAGRYPRLVVPLSMVARLEEFASSKIEYAAGLPVLHYRDAILPLVSVGAMLDRGGADAAMERDSLQVIVFSEGNRHVGLVVDEIQDIVEEAVTVKRASTSFGLLGSGVVGGKITDFIDLGALLQAAIGSHPDAFSSQLPLSTSLLVVDASKIARGVLRGYLEMSGHHVLEASSVETALEIVARNPVRVVITASSLGRSSAGDLLDAMRNREALVSVPVLGLVDESGDLPEETIQGRRFDGVVRASDRDGLLRTIEALAGEKTAGKKEFEMAGSSR